jgi:hypothetical protein
VVSGQWSVVSEGKYIAPFANASGQADRARERKRAFPTDLRSFVAVETLLGEQAATHKAGGDARLPTKAAGGGQARNDSEKSAGLKPACGRQGRRYKDQPHEKQRQLIRKSENRPA